MKQNSNSGIVRCVGFVLAGAGEGKQRRGRVSAPPPPAYITKLEFILEQNPYKSLLESLNLFQTMTRLDKNKNIVPFCSVYYNNELFYFLNITPCYNSKYILSSHTLPTLSQLRIIILKGGCAPSGPSLWARN